MKKLLLPLFTLSFLSMIMTNTHAQFVGPAPLVVPGDNYAFAYSQNGTIGGLTTFGLYFNETSASTPGYEFKGSGGSKLVTVQSIPKGNREPGDITFGATGSLIVNPNRYAFRFSLTNSYGLFFNAAGFAYEFRTADASPVLSIGANNGNLVTPGYIAANGADPLFPLTIQQDGYGFAQFGGDVVLGTWIGAYLSDTGGWYGTNSPHPLYFYVGNGGPSVAIDLNENVGIGTYTPQFRLDVRGNNIDDGGILQLGNQDASHRVVIFPGRLNDPNPFIQWKEGDPMRFATDANGFTEHMRIDTAGNVGIAKQAPQGRLHVEQTEGLYAGYFEGNVPSGSTHIIHAEYTDTGKVDARAVYAESTPISYWGIGLEAQGGYIGVSAATSDDGTRFTANYAVRGLSTGPSLEGAFSTHRGIVGLATSDGPDSTVTNYSILGLVGLGSGTSYAGYFSGDVTVTGTFSNPSDANLKQNVASIENAAEIIGSLQAHQYEFDQENYSFMHLPEGKQYGLIAQEVEEVLPELVKKNVHAASDPKETELPQHPRVEYKSVNYIGLIPLMVQAINEQTEIITEKDVEVEELNEQIEAQNQKIAQQDQKIADLEDKFSKLEQALSSCCTGQKTDQSTNQPINQSTNEPWLGQNIPNPFDRSTVMQYYVPESVSQSTIVVYDRQGREIKSFNLEKGYGEVKFSESDLSAGTYIYSLINDGVVVSTKRMVLN